MAPPPPNDATKFELAWLILWIILTVVLLIVFAFIKRISLPQIIPAVTHWNYIALFLQLCIFVFILAGLADDEWTVSTGSPRIQYGVVRTRGPGGESRNQNNWNCAPPPGVTVKQEMKDWCNTPIQAGVWTLIFGLFAVLSSFFLTIFFIPPLQPSLAPAQSIADACIHIQWITSFACVMIWGVSAHQLAIDSGFTNIELGPSWALFFVAFVLSIVIALSPSSKGAAVTSTTTK